MTPRQATNEQESTVSRRTVLRGAAGAVAFGILGTAATGAAAATNKAELVDAMASQSGLSKADAKRALDGVVSATTRALRAGDRVGIVDFGSFTPRRKRGGAGGRADAPLAVEFTAARELAAALDLVPGAGDAERVQARRGTARQNPGRALRANWGGPAPTVVVDADLLLAELAGNGREAGLSEADAERALDAFVAATTKALKKGDRISLVGFGSFSISKRSARTGRNPQTGKRSEANGKNVVRFKAGAELSK